jgi:hypothetical protein
MKIRADILRADLKRSSRLVEEGANRMHTVAARAMLDAVIDRTPVDTGKAVSNWRVGVGQPTRAVIDAYSPGKLGSTAPMNRAAAKAAGHARIDTKRAENEIFISNNVEYLQYIRRLDGVEDIAVAAGSAAIANMKVL